MFICEFETILGYIESPRTAKDTEQDLVSETKQKHKLKKQNKTK